MYYNLSIYRFWVFHGYWLAFSRLVCSVCVEPKLHRLFFFCRPWQGWCPSPVFPWQRRNRHRTHRLQKQTRSDQNNLPTSKDMLMSFIFQDLGKICMGIGVLIRKRHKLKNYKYYMVNIDLFCVSIPGGGKVRTGLQWIHYPRHEPPERTVKNPTHHTERNRKDGTNNQQKV